MKRSKSHRVAWRPALGILSLGAILVGLAIQSSSAEKTAPASRKELRSIMEPAAIGGSPPFSANVSGPGSCEPPSECPMGAIVEAEACGANCNGGCNNLPAAETFEMGVCSISGTRCEANQECPIVGICSAGGTPCYKDDECPMDEPCVGAETCELLGKTVTVCGEVFADANTRDTDLWRFQVNDPDGDGFAQVSISLAGDGPTAVFVIASETDADPKVSFCRDANRTCSGNDTVCLSNDDCPGEKTCPRQPDPSELTVFDEAASGGGVKDSMVTYLAAPGTYAAVVTMAEENPDGDLVAVFDGFPCGTRNAYTATISVVNACTPGACCRCDGECVDSYATCFMDADCGNGILCLDAAGNPCDGVETCTCGDVYEFWCLSTSGTFAGEGTTCAALPPAVNCNNLRHGCLSATPIACAGEITPVDLTGGDPTTEFPADEPYMCAADGALPNDRKWYSFVATETSVRVHTCDSIDPARDSLLAIFGSACPPSGMCPSGAACTPGESFCGAECCDPLMPLETVGCGDDECGLTELMGEICIGYSTLVIGIGNSTLVIGETYLIQISNWDSQTNGIFSLFCEQPLGDEPCEWACQDDGKINVQCLPEGPEKDNRKSVARLVQDNEGTCRRPGICTAWLIGAPNCLITNRHCVTVDGLPGGPLRDATTLSVEFNYECTCPDGMQKPVDKYHVLELIHENEKLDYALLKVKDNPASIWDTLKVDTGVPKVGDEVYLIHHAQGKKKAYHEAAVNEVNVPGACGAHGDIGTTVISTGGASGSPLFRQENHCVVGLHHCAEQNPGGKPCKDKGWSVLMDLVLPDALPFLTAAGCTPQMCDEPSSKGCCLADNATCVNMDHESCEMSGGTPVAACVDQNPDELGHDFPNPACVKKGCCSPDNTVCADGLAHGECVQAGWQPVDGCQGDFFDVDGNPVPNGIDDACEPKKGCCTPISCITIPGEACKQAGWKPVAMCAGDADWNGIDDACEPCEIDCPKDKLHVQDLPAGSPERINSRAVALLFSEPRNAGFCTAWLIASPDILITNAHCVQQTDFPPPWKAIFNYECTPPPRHHKLVDTYPVAEVIHINKKLDYALLRVGGAPAAVYGALAVDTGAPQLDEPVYLIHHSQGKKKAYMEGTVTSVDIPGQGPAHGDFTKTIVASGGASGSPLFRQSNHCVLGLHYFGPEARCTPGQNVLMDLILPDALPHLQGAGYSVTTCESAKGCCFGDGTCQKLLHDDCIAAQGTPVAACLGDGDSNGVDDSCETKGCCSSDNSMCTNEAMGACVQRKGQPVEICQGDGNNNSIDDACEPVIGCCLAGGSCVAMPVKACMFAGGASTGLCLGDADGSGIDDACEVTGGACCIQTQPHCVDVPSAALCTAADGTSFHPRVSCLTGPDNDGDGIINPCDNCPEDPNNQRPLESYDARPNAAIPDDAPDGVNSAIVVPPGGLVDRIMVDLTVTHTRVGDLTVTLRHDGRSVVLIDRPGTTTAGIGCEADNYVNIRLDDAGTGGSIESMCHSNLESLPSYVPNNPLGALAGQKKAGKWSLNVSDNAAQDVGTLVRWSLHFINVLDKQNDLDGDGVGDACDNCAFDFNPGQEDTGGKAGLGDACDCGGCRIFGDHVFPFCLTPPGQPDVDDISCCVAGFANANDCPRCDMVAFIGECNSVPCNSSADCEAVYGVSGIPCSDGRCFYIDGDDITVEVDAFGGCTQGICCPYPCPSGACIADYDDDGDTECMDGTGVDPNTGEPTGFGMSQSDCINVPLGGEGCYCGDDTVCGGPCPACTP